MAFFVREKYESKEKWAATQLYESLELAILNGATQEQADLIVWLCGARHYIHNNHEDVIMSESQAATEIADLLIDCDSGKSINDKLSDAGLEKIDYKYCYEVDIADDCTYDDDGFNNREEAIWHNIDILRQYEEEILNYIKEFDKKYETFFTRVCEEID